MNCKHCDLPIERCGERWISNGMFRCWGNQMEHRHEPVAEPASPVAQPETEPISEGGNLSSMAYRAAAREEKGAPQSGAGGELCVARVSTSGVEGTYEMCGRPSIVRFNGKPYCSELHSRDAKHYAALRPSSPSGQAAAPNNTKFPLKWSEDAFVLLAGLRHSVIWELAPEIIKEITRLVEEALAMSAASPTGGAEPLYSEQELKELGLKASTINYGAKGSATMYSKDDSAAAGSSAGRDWLNENRVKFLTGETVYPYGHSTEKIEYLDEAAMMEAYAAHVAKGLRAELLSVRQLKNKLLKSLSRKHKQQGERAQELDKLKREASELREQLDQAKREREEYRIVAQRNGTNLVAKQDELRAAEAQLSTAREALLIFGRHLTSCQWIGRDKGDKPSCECKLCDTLAALAPAKEPQ